MRQLHTLDEAICALSPRTVPWSREAFADGGDWTAYLNEGSDPWPVTSYISRMLDTQAVVATCSVDPPHASTQSELIGPSGVPPLLYVRTLAAHCENGRWKCVAEGAVQPFEKVERYAKRRVQDRLDRALLMECLAALGVEPEERSRFRPSAVVSRP